MNPFEKVVKVSAEMPFRYFHNARWSWIISRSFAKIYMKEYRMAIQLCALYPPFHWLDLVPSDQNHLQKGRTESRNFIRRENQGLDQFLVNLGFGMFPSDELSFWESSFVWRGNGAIHGATTLLWGTWSSGVINYEIIIAQFTVCRTRKKRIPKVLNRFIPMIVIDIRIN